MKYQASQAGLLPNGINVSPTKNSKPAAIKAKRCIGPMPSKLPAFSRSTANMAKRATKPPAAKPSPICLFVIIRIELYRRTLYNANDFGIIPALLLARNIE